MIRKQFAIYKENVTEGRKLIGKPFDLEDDAIKEVVRLAETNPGWVGPNQPANTWHPYIYEIVPIYRNIPE
jgi:hypothetical protein